MGLSLHLRHDAEPVRTTANYWSLGMSILLIELWWFAALSPNFTGEYSKLLDFVKYCSSPGHCDAQRGIILQSLLGQTLSSRHSLIAMLSTWLQKTCRHHLQIIDSALCCFEWNPCSDFSHPQSDLPTESQSHWKTKAFSMESYLVYPTALSSYIHYTHPCSSWHRTSYWLLHRSIYS